MLTKYIQVHLFKLLEKIWFISLTMYISVSKQTLITSAHWSTNTVMKIQGFHKRSKRFQECTFQTVVCGTAVHEKLWGLTSLGYAGKLAEFAARSSLKLGDGKSSSLLQTTCGFEFTMPVVNGLPGWRILPKSLQKLR
jgi:hypothetical protein